MRKHTGIIVFINNLCAVADGSLKHFVIPCVGGEQSAVDTAFKYSGKQQRTRRGQVSCEKFCDRILNHVGNNIVKPSKLKLQSTVQMLGVYALFCRRNTSHKTKQMYIVQTNRTP